MLCTYTDMFEVSTEFVRSCHQFLLCDPLHDVVNFTVQYIELEHFLQLALPLVRQILQTGIQLVYLGLPNSYLVTVREGQKVLLIL